MTIDILSDLHVDFYFRDVVSIGAVETLYSHIFTDNQKRKVGDVLIVAGDIGHYNNQSVAVLKLIKEVFSYRDIICVLGNHDYYLLDNDSRSNYGNKSLNRVEELRSLINSQEGMHCLDGNIIEIDGIRFGGCDSWYDREYIKKNFGKKTDGYVSSLWRHAMSDAHYVLDINWQKYAKLEKEKIEKIYRNVDVMTTHVNPLIEKEHTSTSFREEETTGFFIFDGSKYLKDGNVKYWIYGHTHIEAEHIINGVT